MTKNTNVKRLEMGENYLTVSEVMNYLKISRSGAYAPDARFFPYAFSEALFAFPNRFSLFG